MIRRQSRALRSVVLALASAELILALLFATAMLGSADPLGSAIGEGMVRLMAIPLVALTLPALGLALANRWLPLALALVMLAFTIAAVAWRLA